MINFHISKRGKQWEIGPNAVFTFLNKIEACHLNNHSPNNEVNVIRTFRDIEVQIWPFGIV